mmetsp:Transcript_66748/g.159638  ORF Transcript_66748/g.159638 Transcript_66748/m.159638 type:complete len:226 (-) Transcript_66748:232-909(-)
MRPTKEVSRFNAERRHQREHLRSPRSVAGDGDSLIYECVRCARDMPIDLKLDACGAHLPNVESHTGNDTRDGEVQTGVNELHILCGIDMSSFDNRIPQSQRLFASTASVLVPLDVFVQLLLGDCFDGSPRLRIDLSGHLLLNVLGASHCLKVAPEWTPVLGVMIQVFHCLLTNWILIIILVIEGVQVLQTNGTKPVRYELQGSFTSDFQHFSEDAWPVWCLSRWL